MTLVVLVSYMYLSLRFATLVWLEGFTFTLAHKISACINCQYERRWDMCYLYPIVEKLLYISARISNTEYIILNSLHYYAKQIKGQKRSDWYSKKNKVAS